MNTSLPAYTHLESLLLFQSLAAYGVDPSIFSRISELLKRNPHITTHERFESGRLSPDALRNFYLQILKDEIRSERHDAAQDGAGPNGDVKNSRKRKAPSPSLPTVQEAAQHAHLIPKLVEKLYARYRTAITNQIREEEYRYERLQKELQEIERGEWDNRFKEKVNGTSPTLRSQNLPRKSPLLPQTSPHKKQVALDQRGTSSTPQPLADHVPSPQPDRTAQPLHPPPRFPPQELANAAHNDSPPHTHRSPYPPQGLQTQAQPPLVVPPSPSPITPSQANPPSPQDTVVVSSPQGPQFPSQSVSQYGGKGVPQYGPPPATSPQFSPTQQRFPGPHPPGSQSPGVQTPQQQQRNYYAPYTEQPPYPPPQHPQMGQSQGGFMLPPFQVSLQDPSRAHQTPASAPHFPRVSTPVNDRKSLPLTKICTPSVSSTKPSFPPLHPQVIQALASFSTPSSIRTPRSALQTPRSAKTIWKASAIQFAHSPAPRPSVSPIDDIGPPFDPPKQTHSKPKATRKARAKGKGKEKESEPGPVEESIPEVEGRQGRSTRKTATRRARPGSIASSQAGTSIQGRSRSQSVMSHTETIAAETEFQTDYQVKSEPGTSVDVIEEDSAGLALQTSTRRRGTTQPLQTNKRKRAAREASIPESEDLPGTPGLPKTVVAPRHFSRMCNPIMNDIGSHKHASTFTTAVKAKDAEGYYDIIKRPTDLKSIQKAIAAGAKVVAAAASDTPAGSPGGGGGVVEFPLTVDVIPPKAIVNSAQLEKELMRMFVNAVMFNAGEEGVVEDAREMFGTVEQSVSNWRSAERSSGRMEVEETPVPDEDVPTASKRRKL
ncbi:uncharacterized protein BDR25DRAFT_261798 [Lindgomyces ingoldianus]